MTGAIDFRTPGGPRHMQPGYFSLAEVPQRGSVADIAVGTGWWELDQIFKTYAGQFVMVTGVPSHGKSTLILNMLVNMARVHGARSFVYVPENESHLRDKLRSIWGPSEDGWRYFAEHQFFIQSAAVGAYDEPPHTLQWVLEQAIVAIERDNVSLILIDPWNELEHAKPHNMLMTDYIRDCLMWLKAFARHYSVTVILIAHPTKAGVADGKVPNLSDIEGSMAWYNKCDNGLIVVREGETTTTRVISAKAREKGAGKRGVCYFTVDPLTEIFTPQHGAVTL